MKQPDCTASAHPDAIAEARENPLGTLLVIAEELERSGAPKAGLIVREVLATLRSEQPKPPMEAIARVRKALSRGVFNDGGPFEAFLLARNALDELEAFVKAVSK